MMKARVTGGVAIVVAAAAMMLASPPAAAQGDRERLPPQVRETDNPPTLWMYLVLFLLVGGAVAANLIPSKRGHQD